MTEPSIDRAGSPRILRGSQDLNAKVLKGVFGIIRTAHAPSQEAQKLLFRPTGALPTLPLCSAWPSANPKCRRLEQRALGLRLPHRKPDDDRHGDLDVNPDALAGVVPHRRTCRVSAGASCSSWTPRRRLGPAPAGPITLSRHRPPRELWPILGDAAVRRRGVLTSC